MSLLRFNAFGRSDGLGRIEFSPPERAPPTASRQGKVAQGKIAKAFESQFALPPAELLRDGTGPSLWIVVHGYGRGRSSPFPGVFLNHLVARRNTLLFRIRICYTGDAPPPIARGDVVLFWLGDPLERLYPDCFKDAVSIETLARGVGARVLNPPKALSRTGKLTQSSWWSSAGVRCAQAWGFASYDDLTAALPSLPFPLIVRYDYGHSQQGMFFCQSAAEVEAQRANLQFPLTALEFIDTRAGFRKRDPSSIYAQLYHKKRAFVFCDRVVNSHVFFASEPLVSLSSCTFTQQARWNGRLARACGFGRRLLTRTVGADRAFFDGHTEATLALRNAVQVLGLDVAAIDYATDPDGGVVMWEANPYFFLPDGRSSVLPRERQAVRRVEATYDALAAALEHAMACGVARASMSAE